MTARQKTVLTLPTKTTALATDKLMFVANAASANGGNVALITVGNLFGNAHSIPVGQADPANSAAWTGPSGVLFFSNSYGYIAIANNVIRRFAIETF